MPIRHNVRLEWKQCWNRQTLFFQNPRSSNSSFNFFISVVASEFLFIEMHWKTRSSQGRLIKLFGESTNVPVPELCQCHACVQCYIRTCFYRHLYVHTIHEYAVLNSIPRKKHAKMMMKVFSWKVQRIVCHAIWYLILLSPISFYAALTCLETWKESFFEKNTIKFFFWVYSVIVYPTLWF